MLTTRHFSTTLGTGSTSLYTNIHSPDIFAIHCTRLTDLGADLANTHVKR